MQIFTATVRGTYTPHVHLNRSGGWKGVSVAPQV